MKKISLLFVLMLVSFAGIAQEVSLKAQPKLGIRLGYNLSNIDFFWDLEDGGKDWKSGVNFGVVSDLHITDRIVFRPGIYYSMKGTKYLDDTKHCYNYLEAPLLAVFQQPIGERIKLELHAGFYLGVGVGGKKEYPAFVEVFDPYNEKTFKGDRSEKRFDSGFNIGCGLNIDRIYLGASYEDGFVSLDNGRKNHCLMVNVGYSF